MQSLGLLSLVESILELEAGPLFATGGLLLVSSPTLYALQINDLVPTEVPLQALFSVATLVGGGTLLAVATLISQLQLASERN